MTTNQIAFNKLLEEQRANRAQENLKGNELFSKYGVTSEAGTGRQIAFNPDIGIENKKLVIDNLNALSNKIKAESDSWGKSKITDIGRFFDKIKHLLGGN